MGRHSAPDDVADEAVVSAAETAILPTVFTELNESAGDTRVAEISPAAPAAEAKPVSPTRADVNLLRAAPGLRAQALAGVVVPYLLYTVIMVLLARTDVYLIWLWIPTVLAGALVGHMLDRAHAASAKSGQAEPSRPSSADG